MLSATQMWERVLFDPSYLFSRGVPILMWIGLIIVLFSMFKSGKIYTNAIGKGEIGGRELFGIALWPVLFGPGISVKGITTVRRTAKTPTRVEELRARVVIDGKTYVYVAMAIVQVIRRWKSLKKVLYNFIDEDKGDLDNPERTSQLKGYLESALRSLIETRGRDAVSLSALLATEVEFVDFATGTSYDTTLESVLTEYFGMSLRVISLQELTPTDAQTVANAVENGANNKGATVIPFGAPDAEASA